MTATEVAEAAGLPVNTVPVRAALWFRAQVDAVPKLAVALGIADLNELLPKEEEDQLGLAYRDRAESFVRVLRDTHFGALSSVTASKSWRKPSPASPTRSKNGSNYCASSRTVPSR